ncbi:MAG: glycosyltransferase family 2 protein [Mucilaginibacter sp.]|uniref:glycosyltransferase family 2 protein n=1 Tax=Mucilaginibacter sp. TaxID=1882438 RepID=UPI00261F6F01|nr:glycosyltransferase [Mucilaginibacter sp.]MDB5003981.1 glycosyltransferase family 2 protein [Mucilaginibacter sp.]
MAPQVLKIATLACSYNRLEKTKAFLKSLTTQYIPEGYTLDIYMLDDQSPDGTANYVRECFPSVDIINGTGSLFWAGGMRMLWHHVVNTAEYDFFILLNDDVKLFDRAIDKLLAAYHKSTFKDNVLIGTVQNPDHTKITYGGRKLLNGYNGDAALVEPDANELKECDLGNANIMLVDKGTVDKIGILSGRYIHSFADFDYTLNAKRHGVKVWVAPGFYGSCEYDHGKPWLSSEHTLKQRIAYMHSPKGIESKSYLRYIRKFFPLNYPAAVIKLWLKTLLPVVYDKYKKD